MARRPARFQTSNGETHPLVTLLAQSKLTKSELADLIGVRPQTIGVWVRRASEDNRFKLPINRAVQIANVFGVPVSTLYWGE